MADAQGEEEPVEPALFGSIDGCDQVGGAFLSKPLQRQKLLRGKSVEVGHVADELGLDELLDDLRAQVLDVHDRPPGEVSNPLALLRGAGRIRAAPRHLPLGSVKGGLTDGTGIGHFKGFLVVGALVGYDHDDFRDDIAAPLDKDGISLADVFASHFVFVVEGGTADGRPADTHRGEPRHRCHHPRATDVHLNPLYGSHGLRGGKLVGDGPAGMFGRGSELFLKLVSVDLDDHAIGVVIEAVALLLDGEAVLDGSLDGGQPSALLDDRKAGLF